MYAIELIWNREFSWSNFGYEDTLEEAIIKAKDIENSGDGARVKKTRILDEDYNIVWQYGNGSIIKNDIANINKLKLYICSFCGKQEHGKPNSWLNNPLKSSNHDVALKPNGWWWDIVPVKFTDRWCCGCELKL